MTDLFEPLAKLTKHIDLPEVCSMHFQVIQNRLRTFIWSVRTLNKL